jgi:antitoxin HicB
VRGSEFLRRTRRYARIHGLEWQWQPKLGKGSHGVLRVGERWTTVRYLKDELKDGTLRDAPPAWHPEGRALSEMPFTEMTYPVRIRRLPVSDGWTVSCRDLPELHTDGESFEAALESAEGAAQAALEYRLRNGLPIPRPRPLRRGEALVAIPLETALKVLLREAVRQRGSQSAVARRLGVDEKAVRRLLDPDHGSRVEALSSTLRKLGLRVAVKVIDAA